jgi:hypothetical protein
LAVGEPSVRPSRTTLAGIGAAGALSAIDEEPVEEDPPPFTLGAVVAAPAPPAVGRRLRPTITTTATRTAAAVTRTVGERHAGFAGGGLLRSRR